MKTFSIGDRVRIIGPSNVSSRGAVNHIFTISEMQKPDDEILYSEKCYGWYPASSLELAEPGLQIGDWVEVIGPDYHGCCDWIGNVFKIERITPESYCTAYHVPLFPKSYLRKLTDDEIAERLNQKPNSVKFDCNVSEFSQKLKESHDKAVQVSKIGKIHEIEKKITQFDKEIDGLRNDIGDLIIADGDVEARIGCKLMELGKRLDFVEQFQKDQSESNHRCIREPIFGAGP